MKQINISLFFTVRRQAPAFSRYPEKEIWVDEGQSVNITCIAVGSPMPQVRWLEWNEAAQQWQQVPGSSMAIGKIILELRNVRRDVNFTCEAYSSLGSIQAQSRVKVKSMFF